MKKANFTSWHYSLLTTIIFGFLCGPVNAAIFMFIPDIPGESNDANHPDWIDVLSASGTFSQNSCGGFSVTKEIDKAFPLLVTSVVSGKVFPDITIEFTANYGGARAVYSTITLNAAKITNIATSASGNDAAVPVENITIQASSITIEYVQYDDTGGQQGTITETVICGKIK